MCLFCYSSTTGTGVGVRVLCFSRADSSANHAGAFFSVEGLQWFAVAASDGLQDSLL